MAAPPRATSFQGHRTNELGKSGMARVLNHCKFISLQLIIQLPQLIKILHNFTQSFNQFLGSLAERFH